MEKTGEAFDIHDVKRQMKNVMAKLERASFGEGDKRLIREFMNDLGASGTKELRQMKYANHLITLRLWLGKPFEKATEADMKALMNAHLNNGDYAALTKRDYKITLVMLYRWLLKLKKNERPPLLEFLEMREKKADEKLPEGIMTEDDIRLLISAAPNSKLKAMIACLYESGARIAEFLTMRRKDVALDKYGAVLYLKGKTGVRRVRIVWSAPYLREWMNNFHPLKNDDEAPVWPSARNPHLPPRYTGIRARIQEIAEAAGMKKKVNPHSFRHARATLLSKSFSDSQMKVFFGWARNSDMASVYVHLSGKDCDDDILRLNGVKKQEIKEATPQVRYCPLCRAANPPTEEYCLNKECGSLLNPAALKAQLDEKHSEATENISEARGMLKALSEANKQIALQMKQMAQMRAEMASALKQFKAPTA